MKYPIWVDLKGEDAVPETVHHVIVKVNPRSDKSWKDFSKRIPTDSVHVRDPLSPNSNTPGTYNVVKTQFVLHSVQIE